MAYCLPYCKKTSKIFIRALRARGGIIMKAFKKLATLSMALLFAFGLSALTACGGDDSSVSSTTSTTSAENKTYTHYEFTLLDKDGNKVESGYMVQLCTANMSNCYNPVAIANGVCVYTNVTEKGVYEAHVLNADFETVALKETVRTSADAFGEYTLTLAE